MSMAVCEYAAVSALNIVMRFLGSVVGDCKVSMRVMEGLYWDLWDQWFWVWGSKYSSVGLRNGAYSFSNGLSMDFYIPIQRKQAYTWLLQFLSNRGNSLEFDSDLRCQHLSFPNTSALKEGLAVPTP